MTKTVLTFKILKFQILIVHQCWYRQRRARCRRPINSLQAGCMFFFLHYKHVPPFHQNKNMHLQRSSDSGLTDSLILYKMHAPSLYGSKIKRGVRHGPFTLNGVSKNASSQSLDMRKILIFDGALLTAKKLVHIALYGYTPMSTAIRAQIGNSVLHGKLAFRNHFPDILFSLIRLGPYKKSRCPVQN